MFSYNDGLDLLLNKPVNFKNSSEFLVRICYGQCIKYLKKTILVLSEKHFV